VDDGALRAERWFGGPAANRRAYAVDDVAALWEGDITVVRAERLPEPDEPEAYTGPVSLKLHTDTSSIDTPQLTARLDAVAAVRHPSLGRPIEAFVGPGLARRPDDADTADDVFYVAARWEDGRPLRVAVPMAPDAALAVVRGGAGAGGARPRHGLTHRDLHPGNVIVRPDGTPVVIDFDTVRPDDGAATTTIAGVVGFIAPEAVTGGCGRDADRWSVGMLAVYALLGHPQGSTPTPMLRRELEDALAGSGDSGRTTADILQMIDPDPQRRPPDLLAWVDRLERHVRHRSTTSRIARSIGGSLDSRWRRTLAIAAVLVAIVVGASALAVREPRESSTAAAPLPTPTSSPTPGPPRRAACPDGAVPDEIGAPPGSCWAGSATAFVLGTTRLVESSGGAKRGMYVTAPDGRAVYLTQPLWQSYSEISGKSPLDSPAYGGYPVGIDSYDDPDAVAIRLDNGGLVMGPREDTQLFWIPAQGVQRWSELGGLRGALGFPSSILKVSLEGAVIEFQRGALHVSADNVAPLYAGQTVPIELVIPADPADGLDIDAIRDRLVRQWDGTAWWVDGAGVRHWVPDPATWACLGGDDAVFPGADDLHGWTVWLFPLGAPATCADGAPRRSDPATTAVPL
jgi:hypothetical protein